ncbi:CoA transferase [Variovorax sp.]|uniref:CaiB/BaiF CoA transferase family protein n=1 Tax=Variovorax sp. TaxID=1871043 RepID=UPI002D4BB29D|nr:CoA transferase [Variovorax sp.]HYP82600.1 CoA transferase [Variovorax sp.]
MAGALAGVRVLDMTTVGMGPMATQLLGDFGADVVKVEPMEGDIFRHVMPQKHAGMSHAYLNLNRNKRSVQLGMKAPGDHDRLMALLADSDVFISNMRAPALRRLGLDAETLLARFPRLIHCSCYGYSESGPYAGRPAIDDTIQAACGLAWLQGGAGQDAPAYVKSVVADKAVALYVTSALGAALYAREKTGEGQAIEVPMFECMVSFMAVEHLAGRTFVPPQGPAGYTRLLNEFRRPFRTKDGYLTVVPYTDGQWHRFFELVGEPALADDERYRTQAARSHHFGELYAYAERMVASKPTAEWLALLESADIPFARVNSIDDLLVDPHLQSVGFWREVEHPTEGRLMQAGLPVHFSRTPATVRRHAPALGEHNAALLAGRPSNDKETT